MRDVNKRTGKPLPPRSEGVGGYPVPDGHGGQRVLPVWMNSKDAKLNAPGDVGPEKGPRVLNPKDAAAQGKVRLGLLPAAGIIHGALAATDGADKYGPYNWRTGPAISMMTYLDALERHIMALRDGEVYDFKSGVHHLGHVIAGAAIILDAEAVGQLVDDRPSVGPAGSLMRNNER